jgi:N-acetylneuraminic acid mutarotase
MRFAPYPALVLAWVVFVLAGGCTSGSPLAPTQPPDTTPPAPPGQQGTWSTAADMIVGLSEFGAARYRDRIYVAGGLGPSDVISERVYRYDPSTDAWEQLADLPKLRFAMPLVVVGDTMYGVGGFLQIGGFRTTTLWAYQPDTDTWEERAGLPEEIVKAGATVIGGEIVLAGGSNGNAPIRDLVDSLAFYDPVSDAWHRGPPILTMRTALSGVTVGGVLFAVQGINDNGALDIIESFNPATGLWAQLEGAQTARFETAAAVLENCIHVFGGIDFFSQRSKRHEVFDPQSGDWEAFPDLPTARSAPAAVTFDDAIYVLGGQLQSGGKARTVNVFRLNP